MNRVFGLFLLLVCAGESQASYCYTPSYPQSYSGYSHYQQPSYYQYQPYYVSYPVASYVGIPIPIFGSVYTGPNGAAQTQTTTTTRTATATQTVGVATAAGGGTTAAVVSSDTQQILSSLKTLTGLVGRVAQKQEQQDQKQDQHDARLLVIERRHSELLKRFAMVESRVSGPATGPVGMPKAETIPQTWVLRCGVCHQNGNESKGGGFVLLGIGGVRASLTAKQAQKLLRSLTAATMPPKDNKEKVPPLTNDETSQLIEDIPNFPIKKE